MKSNLTILAALAALLTASGAAHAAALTTNNLVVSRVGDGSNTLANTGGPISILEFTRTGSVVQTINVSTTTTSGLQLSGTASSEGALSRAQDGSGFSIAGYIPPFSGTGTITGRTDAQAPRGFTTLNLDGTVDAPTAIGAYSGNNIRSAVESNTGAYFAGGNTGTIYRAGGSNTTVQSANTNTRVVNIENGNLYYSTGSGTQGIYGFSGVPTAATAPTAIITGVTNQGTSPFDFAFSPDGTVAYVADSSLGIQKFTFDGSAWSLAYNITTATTGLTGLGVDFSGANPQLFAVSPTNLFAFTDLGVTGDATSIATAGTNYAFRGLEIVPEPATIALLLGGFGLLALRRRRAS